MVVYFTTVIRSAPEDRGGEIVKLDWDRKKVLARAPIRAQNPTITDPNPRGSTRGGRGILMDGDHILAASYHSILGFDRQLQMLGQISNPLFANLHELAWDDGAIWATSTDIDAAVKVDRGGHTLDCWWPREDPVTSRRFNLEPLAIDKAGDNRTTFVGVGDLAASHVHLNAAAMDQHRPLMLLNRFGAVVRLNPTEVVVADDTLRGCHNLWVTANGLLLTNDTRGRALRVYDQGGRLVKHLPLLSLPGVRRLWYRYAIADGLSWLGRKGRPSRLWRPLLEPWRTARPLFLRGMFPLDERRLLVGLSPATLLLIDWVSETLLDSYSYSTDRHVCVHGLTCDNA